MKVKILLVTGTILITGCSGQTAHLSNGEHFAMYGTPEGIRAYSDYMVGSLKTSKEEPRARNQYLAMRQDYEANITTRELHKPKTFWQKLMEQDESRDQTGDAAIEKGTN